MRSDPIAFRIPKELLEKFDESVRRKKMTRSTLLRLLILKYTQKRDKINRLKSKGI